MPDRPDRVVHQTPPLGGGRGWKFALGDVVRALPVTTFCDNMWITSVPFTSVVEGFFGWHDGGYAGCFYKLTGHDDRYHEDALSSGDIIDLLGDLLGGA